MQESVRGYRVATEDHDRVRVFTLDRPEKLNAFTAEGYRVLTGELGAAAAAPEIRACVITGRGRAFSAGVDLSEMSRPGGAAELGTDFDPLLTALATFPKPLIAAVNGLAVGFGATLLLHCDLVVIDEAAEDPDAVHRVGNMRRGRQQLAPPPAGGDAAGKLDGAVRIGAQRRSRRGQRVRARSRWRQARRWTPRSTSGGSLPSMRRPLLGCQQETAQGGLGRHDRRGLAAEKDEMKAIAEQLGSIGWSRSG